MSPHSLSAAASASGPASAITAGVRAAGRAWLSLLRATLAALVGVAALAGCSSAAGHQAGHTAARPAVSGPLGTYPSFLPRDTLNYHSDAVLVGTVRQPALTSQGDGVEAKTSHWSVLITVTGPQVPGEGLPYQAPTTTCTWVVTMSRATGAVPISLADFASIDSLSNVYRPAFVAGQPAPPAVLRPGKKVSFELRAVMPTGEGLMLWAPDGRNVIAKWDFIVEND